MKKLIAAAALLGAATAFADEVPLPPVITETEKASVVASLQDFSSDLYGQLRSAKGNLFFSPGSITQALAMTYAGARSDTATEMQTALRLRMNPDYTHASFRELIGAQNQKQDAYTFHTANALWVQKGFDIDPAYKDIVEKNYHASISSVDYETSAPEAVSTINSWVADKTAQKIKDLIPLSAVDTNTRLILTNAVYFKADWQDAFEKGNTHQEEFFLNPAHTGRVWLMNRTCKDCRYGENANYQVAGIPYKGGDMEMVVFLPRDRSGLAAFEEALNPQTLREGLELLASGEEVNLALPRFRLESQFSLGKTLAEMGMKTAFSAERADFSGITGKRDLYITEAVHKAFVEVDETGTEAATATGIMMGITSAPISQPKQFRADHPFLFLIRSRKSGEIHFMGRVVDPGA